MGSKYYTFKVQDTRTGIVYETMTKDKIDAVEMVADTYDLDIDFLEVV